MLYRWGVVSDEYGEGAPHTAGLAQPHPGVAPPPPGEDVVYHRYYQWVVFVLFLQASMFHLPRIVWKHLEGGLMKMLVGDFTDPLMLISKDRRLERVAFIRRYFQETTKVRVSGYLLVNISTYLQSAFSRATAATRSASLCARCWRWSTSSYRSTSRTRES